MGGPEFEYKVEEKVTGQLFFRGIADVSLFSQEKLNANNCLSCKLIVLMFQTGTADDICSLAPTLNVLLLAGSLIQCSRWLMWLLGNC